MPHHSLSITLTLLLALPASAATHRSREQRDAFQHSHPCPSTGKTKGACPGYVVDHVKPLCAGGADHPSNTQWQPKSAAKAKDRDERKQRKGR